MKNVHRISTKQHRGHEMRRLVIQNLNHLASGLCWYTAMLEGVKVKLSSQVCKSDHFERFCGCNGKTSAVCH